MAGYTYTGPASKDAPFTCDMDVGNGGMTVIKGSPKLLNGLRGLGRSASDDLQTVIFAVNGITKHQVMSLAEIGHEKKALELAAMNRAQLQNAIARDDKAAINALTMTQGNLERRAAMHKAAARAHAVASEQSALVAQNLEAATGRSSRGMNGLGEIGSDEDVRRRKEAASALHTQLNTSAALTFDGKAIAGKGWVDAFRSAVRKGYDVPMPKEQMSAKRVGIGTDTDVFAAKENYVGATLQGVGLGYSYVSDGSKEAKHCDGAYPKGQGNAKQDEYNRLCKISTSWTGPYFSPWTAAGKTERGLPVDWVAVIKQTVMDTFMKRPAPKKSTVEQVYDQTVDYARNFDQRTQQQTGMSASTLAIGALVLGAVGIYAYKQSKGA